MQYFGPKSPQVINFWGAKVTPSLGSQATQIFNFITSVGSEHSPFPRLPYFKFQNKLRQNVKCFLALYQCLKSLFKVTEAVTYFLGTKSSQVVAVTLTQP